MSEAKGGGRQHDLNLSQKKEAKQLSRQTIEKPSGHSFIELPLGNFFTSISTKSPLDSLDESDKLGGINVALACFLRNILI